MKSQKGFTLIELLLVLAIIGIISAIAIPAMLNQRARARDKSAVTNTLGRVPELASQIDQLVENGADAAAVQAGLVAYMTQTTANAKNPWAGKGGAPAEAINVTPTAGLDSTDKAAFDTALAALAVPANLGQGQFGYSLPTAALPGFAGGAVYVWTKNSGTRGGATQEVFKSIAVE